MVTSYILFQSSPFQKTFTVDEFLHDNRNSANLETIRDDLGIYLKVLRSAMIELINEDYADFVDLSANLIGLDQSIEGIKTPLGQLKSDVLTVRDSLQTSMSDLKDCLEEKRNLRKHKKCLQSLSSCQKSLKKLESLLLVNDASSDNINLIILERSALELIQLQFNMKFCINLFDNSQKNAAKNLREILLEKIETYFLKIVNKKNNLQEIERCLRIYCTLDECSIIENIFRQKIIAPYMNKIISEHHLQNSPQGVTDIFNQILDFISIYMKDLLQLTSKNNNTNNSKIKGINFLINSFWVEVEQRLETNIASIFAPGNPDMFYHKYNSTLEFLKRIEMLLSDSVEVQHFHNDKYYKSFQLRWNLPVYFQIRFQEIATVLESALNKPINSGIYLESNEKDSFKLIQFSTAFTCLEKCWYEGIYLEQLFHKFFKFSLQIVARLHQFLVEILKIQRMEINKVNFFITAYYDIQQFISRLPNLLNVIVQKCPTVLIVQRHQVEQSFDEAQKAVADKLTDMERIIINEVITTSLQYIKQINDIPRLYRKTNREVPTKHGQYIESIMFNCNEFQQNYERFVGNEIMQKFLRNIFTNITRQYVSKLLRFHFSYLFYSLYFI